MDQKEFAFLVILKAVRWPQTEIMKCLHFSQLKMDAAGLDPTVDQIYCFQLVLVYCLLFGVQMAESWISVWSLSKPACLSKKSMLTLANISNTFHTKWDFSSISGRWSHGRALLKEPLCWFYTWCLLWTRTHMLITIMSSMECEKVSLMMS